jgi:hypothetical protein
MSDGTPYQECIQLTGSKPFTLLSHNLKGAGQSAEIIGETLCIKIDNPSSKIDFVAEVKGGCAGCKAETIKSEIAFTQSVDACACIAVTIPTQTLPPLVVGQYFATVRLSGSQPFQLCGGAAPRCLQIELSGNIVKISGRYDGVGDVAFSVKNACTCECVDFVIPKA